MKNIRTGNKIEMKFKKNLKNLKQEIKKKKETKLRKIETYCFVKNQRKTLIFTGLLLNTNY